LLDEIEEVWPQETGVSTSRQVIVRLQNALLTLQFMKWNACFMKSTHRVPTVSDHHQR
jgi:hypothetical protein